MRRDEIYEVTKASCDISLSGTFVQSNGMEACDTWKK